MGAGFGGKPNRANFLDLTPTQRKVISCGQNKGVSLAVWVDLVCGFVPWLEKEIVAALKPRYGKAAHHPKTQKHLCQLLHKEYIRRAVKSVQLSVEGKDIPHLCPIKELQPEAAWESDGIATAAHMLYWQDENEILSCIPEEQARTDLKDMRINPHQFVDRRVIHSVMPGTFAVYVMYTNTKGKEVHESLPAKEANKRIQACAKRAAHPPAPTFDKAGKPVKFETNFKKKKLYVPVPSPPVRVTMVKVAGGFNIALMLLNSNLNKSILEREEMPSLKHIMLYLILKRSPNNVHILGLIEWGKRFNVNLVPPDRRIQKTYKEW